MLPGGAPLHPRYTKGGMILILVVTVVGSAVLWMVFREAVKEAHALDESREQTPSALWGGP